MPDKVVIIGGGIGGLAAALALLQRGLDVEIHEQAPRAEGGRRRHPDQLQRHARALRARPRGARSSACRCCRPGASSGTGARGETWNWFDLGPVTAQRYGTPHVMLHRGDLHGVLAEAVRARKPDAVKLGRRCADIASDDDRAEVRFEGGETVQAAYVIGADGIHSKVRACLFGADKPEFTGAVAWRGLVPMDKLPPHLAQMQGVNWLGPHGHVLHYPVRRGEIMNFISFVERDDWQVEVLGDAGHQGRARQRLPRLAPRRARDHRAHRDALQMGDDGARPDGALEQGPRHAARRRLPSDAAVPRPGRRDGDRGRLYRRRLPRQVFRRSGHGVRALRGHPPRAHRHGGAQERTRTAARRSARRSPTATRSRSKWRASGSRSACASGWNGCTPTTPPRSRCDAGCGYRLG